MKKANVVLLTIAAAIVCVYAFISFAGDSSELIESLAFFGIIVVIGGLGALRLGKERVLLSASLLVFVLEFAVFAFPALSVNQDTEHITAVLQGNPTSITNSYVQELARNAFWYGILPTILGIGLYISSFVAGRKALVGWFRNVLLLIGGGFILYCGTSVFQYTQEYVNGANGDYIASSFRTIYLPQEWLGILWIVAGIIFIITSVPYLARALAQLVARELRSNRLPKNAEKATGTYD